ncbi:SDR family oxidoreductase [Actinokineospora auranticolor]|uniref:3-oxoacyl-[acyl-carrier protein] reductase n=1 Tax=Actinokineospora auranticolor TaxID=155976 RepID=A0A2S6GLM5_9PSEU|nr:SDR family oxidoreductase [Actinokineospora auranticolor]PPK66073.1 3-oxoacyl-[acyl-carrier protein] reductase [Actinokineospora auranticolor]
MIDINGKVAFLTGAAEGLGREIARELVAGGMRVAMVDVQGEKLTALAEELRADGADVLPLVVDLADPVAAADAVELALAHYGTPRVLIHNAAVLKEVSMLDVTFEDWRREVDIILGAAYALTKTVWPHMVQARDGSIVFLSSGSALFGFVKETAYTPGKHAQEGLMKVLALEGKEHNIAVNTTSTGRPIDTPMSDSHYTEEMRIGIVPPSRLAPAFAFLAGIDADFATGQRFNAYQLSEAIRVTRG